MKKLILFIFISFSLQPSSISASGLFKRNKNKKSKSSFRERLRKKIMHKNKLNYKEARRLLFGDIHLDRSTITDIYCNKSFSNKDIKSRFKIEKRRIPNHSILNAEHVWPKSKFFAKKIRGKFKRFAKAEFRTRQTDPVSYTHLTLPTTPYV